MLPLEIRGKTISAWKKKESIDIESSLEWDIKTLFNRNSQHHLDPLRKEKRTNNANRCAKKKNQDQKQDGWKMVKNHLGIS